MDPGSSPGVTRLLPDLKAAFQRQQQKEHPRQRHHPVGDHDKAGQKWVIQQGIDESRVSLASKEL